MQKCDHCPFRDDAETRCAAQVTRHVAFCRMADPAAPGHRPAMVEAVRRLTLEPLGRYAPPPAPATRPPPAPIPGARPAPAPFPSLSLRARNLAGAIATAAASGFERATPEEAARRLSICGGTAETPRCENYTGASCRLCGCTMSWKVQMAAWHCPIGKF